MCLVGLVDKGGTEWELWRGEENLAVWHPGDTLMMGLVVAEHLQSDCFSDVGFRPSAAGVDAGTVINRNELVLHSMLFSGVRRSTIARFAMTATLAASFYIDGDAARMSDDAVLVGDA